MMTTIISQRKNRSIRASKVTRVLTNISDTTSQQHELFAAQIALDKMLKLGAVANGTAEMNPETPDEKEYKILTDRIMADVERARNLAFEIRLKMSRNQNE